MDSNPYSAPEISTTSNAYESVASQGNMLGVVQPLYEASSWLKLLGWTNIVIGVLYCITIVGAIVGWLPLWLGFLLKNAGERMSTGYATGDLRSIHDACGSLKTVFTIMGVLMLINLCIIALYIVFIIFAVVVGVVAGAAN